MAENIYYAIKDPLIRARIQSIEDERSLYRRMTNEIQKLQRQILAEMSLATNDRLSKRELLIILLVLIKDQFLKMSELAQRQFNRVAKKNRDLIHKVFGEALEPTGLKKSILRNLSNEDLEKIVSAADSGWDFEERLKSIEKEMTQAIIAAVNSSKDKKYNFELITASIVTASKTAQRSAAIRASNQYTNILSQISLEYANLNSRYIRFVKFSAILDSRTSQICRRFNGRVYDLIRDRGNIPIPKLHPNCRSELIPIFDVQALIREGAEDSSYLSINPEEIETLSQFLKRTS